MQPTRPTAGAPLPSADHSPSHGSVYRFIARAHPRLIWIGMGLLLFALMLVCDLTAIRLDRWSEQHDLNGHVDYCQSIARNHALPHPRSGWTTYHPPLFYLFTQPFKPLQENRDVFIRDVRWASSILFGSLFLICMLGVARTLNLGKLATLFVVGFLITLPSVVQLFASFNSDAMATSLTSLVALSALKFYRARCRRAAVAWGILGVLAGTLALYTKFTFLFASFALAAFLAMGLATLRLKARAFWLMGMGALCLLALLPYLYLHNYKSTGKLFPHNVDRPESMPYASLDLHGGRLRFLLMPPLLTDGEWSTPYTTAAVEGDAWWPKRNMLASAFSTSLHGEWDFERTGRPNGRFLLRKNTWGWLDVWAHISFLLLFLVPRTSLSRAAMLLAGLIFAGHAVHVMAVMPFSNAANFRYYAWILLPLAVTAAAGLEQRTHGRRRTARASYAVLALGTFIHLGFVLSAL
jgi:hypothetical protein